VPFSKGGGRSYGKNSEWTLEKLISQWRKKKTDVWITSLFDVYDLPLDFPARTESLKIRDDYAKVSALESAWEADIRILEAHRFIPHLQLHEI